MLTIMNPKLNHLCKIDMWTITYSQWSSIIIDETQTWWICSCLCYNFAKRKKNALSLWCPDCFYADLRSLMGLPQQQTQMSSSRLRGLYVWWWGGQNNEVIFPLLCAFRFSELKKPTNILGPEKTRFLWLKIFHCTNLCILKRCNS